MVDYWEIRRTILKFLNESNLSAFDLIRGRLWSLRKKQRTEIKKAEYAELRI